MDQGFTQFELGRRLKKYEFEISKTSQCNLHEEHNLEKTKKQTPTKEATQYLRGKSLWCLNYAINYFSSGSNDRTEVTLNNLGYAISFSEFADRYDQGSKILTLEDIQQKLLSKLRKYIKLNKRREINIEEIELKDFFKGKN